MFSRVSAMLKNNNVATLSKLKNKIESSYSPKPFVDILEDLLDIKAHVKEILPKTMKNHSLS